MEKQEIHWSLAKIPIKEEICVQYCDNDKPIAISTKEKFTGQFKMYKVDEKNQKLIVLGKSNEIFKLEDKYISVSKDKKFKIKNQKEKIK